MKDIDVGKQKVLQVEWGWSWDAEGDLMSMQLASDVYRLLYLLLSTVDRNDGGTCAEITEKMMHCPWLSTIDYVTLFIIWSL